jgi:prevent-host-death family protein
MKTVGVRELKQNASAVVAEAAAGESVLITVRGRAVAQLVPLPQGRLATLVAAGRARPARRRLEDLGPPPRRKPGAPTLSGVLAAMRDDERY